MKENNLKQLIRRPDMADCIAQVLRAELLANGKPGARFHTLRALCERFEATTHTIRAALKLLEREGLIDVWPGSGAFVREPSRRHQHIALIIGVHSEHQRQGYFLFRVLEYLDQFLTNRDLTPRVYWARDTAAGGSLAEFRRAVEQGEVAGVIILKGPLTPDWCAAVNRVSGPVVGGDRKDAAYTTRVDYGDLIEAAAGFLAGRGRRRMGLLAWSPDAQADSIVFSDDCGRLFQESVKRHGGETHAEWLRCDLFPVTPGAGYALFRELWMARAEKPEALLITDEVFFADVAAAILEIGIRVPEQLLIVTHANTGSGMLYPFPVARLEYDPDHTGALLGEQLWHRLRNEPAAAGVATVPFRWVGVEAVTKALVQAGERADPDRGLWPPAADRSTRITEERKKSMLGEEHQQQKEA